jgi:hypothetical protein
MSTWLWVILMSNIVYWSIFFYLLTTLNAQIVPGTILYFDEITGWESWLTNMTHGRKGSTKH